jgi:hypothetical protein
MGTAHQCEDFDALLSFARIEGAGYLPPVADDEITKTAASAWGYTQRGENRVGVGRVVVTAHGEVDALAATNPDAFALLAILRRHHWGRERFPVAKAMAESLGWTMRRFKTARCALLETGFLECLDPGGWGLGRGKGTPPIFRFPA